MHTEDGDRDAPTSSESEQPPSWGFGFVGDRLGVLARSSVVRGATKVAGGAAAAQIIAIGVSPILTRLYSPTAFGVFSAFIAVTTVLVTISAARYEMSIVLPESEEEATSLTVGALAIVGITSLAVAAVMGLVVLADIGGVSQSVGLWLLLAPVATLLGGATAVFASHAVRRGRFGLVGKATAIRQASGSIVQIGAGLVQWAAGGLILGALVGAASANLRLGGRVLAAIRQYRPSPGAVWDILKRYKKFPRYSLPDALLNSVAIWGVPLAVGGLYGAATLGIFALAYRVLTIPVGVVGAGVGESFYKHLVEWRGDKDRSLRLFDKTVGSLAAISLPPFILLGIFAPDIFGFVFGEEWTDAGLYSRIMLLWLWLQFISSPVSRTILVYERNEWGLVVQGCLLSALVLSTTLGFLLDLKIESYLALLSGLYCLCYGTFIVGWRRMITKQG